MKETAIFHRVKTKKAGLYAASVEICDADGLLLFRYEEDFYRQPLRQVSKASIRYAWNYCDQYGLKVGWLESDAGIRTIPIRFRLDADGTEIEEDEQEELQFETGEF
ncbi:hypothetical protein LCY76_09405 [Fictibacillus sp. KIGAM418]|uniref:Uncharacterized protein n=1 Tax=Fictibacillus marinisediminis TaxID=2878389 RepID=A0A9X2BDL6_9BACL|nr:hypothetical protein [Fictibacillus marinisediminis]MCK6256810.1 hypothetical protein [Fictibacillus marinisediminis]